MNEFKLIMARSFVVSWFMTMPIHTSLFTNESTFTPIVAWIVGFSVAFMFSAHYLLNHNDEVIRQTFIKNVVDMLQGINTSTDDTED